MESKSIRQGDLLAKKDTPMDSLWYISEGRVEAVSGSLRLTLKKGDFIGITDFNRGVNSFDYYAKENSTVINFCSRDALMQSNFFAAKPENSRALALSLNHIVRDAFISLNAYCSRSEVLDKFVTEYYQKYLDFCKALFAEPKNISLLDELGESISMGYTHKCLYQYHKGTSMQLSNKESALELIKNLVIPGYMHHAVTDLAEVVNAIEYVSAVVGDYNCVLIDENRNDFLEAFNDLYMKAGPEHSLSEEIKSCIVAVADMAIETPEDIKKNRIEEIKRKAVDFDDVSSSSKDGANIEVKLANSMEQIFELANFTGEPAENLRTFISQYKNLVDPNSTEDDARRIRKEIEKYFYMLYLSALEKSIELVDCPILLKMFLHFGYLDEELAGMDNAVQLYELAQTYHGDPSRNIFTGLEWLIAIFTKDREPSINEFDQTYEQFIKEQAESGRIPHEQVKLYLKDRGQMVMFELQNMFRSASRMCSGRVLNFCPVFCEHQILRGAKDDLIDYLKVIEARNNIRNIDYTLFYRETVFVYNKKENIHDIIHVEILPDIVLLPVVGNRGAMWQEISGRDRMTPARMMLPVFDTEDLEKALIRMFAEYRWEMCKRTQGARWNDVTDPSLTSLYYDYLQFYRRNSQISTEQKEKIKIGLQRARNTYKEYFINDYSEYIKYESLGSPHLIRASRTILYLQVPFGASVRRSLSSNPIFSELDGRLNIKNNQALHKLDNIKKKLEAKGYDIPKELEREIAYYSI